MKYEMIFGDQSLFDNASDGAVLAIKDTTSGRIHFFTNKGWIKSGLKHERHIGTSDNGIAMRRIIKEPKRRTWEDKKAGRLPDVGSKAVSVHGFCVVDILAVRNGCVVACNSDISDARPCVFTIDNFLELYTPIETPEERAKREREEWCSKALDSAGILSEMKRYELKRLGEYIGSIHDALLSGELQAPKGGE